MLELLDISEEQFATKILSANTQDVQEFNVFKRADHVYLEALRVVQVIALYSNSYLLTIIFLSLKTFVRRAEKTPWKSLES